MNVCKHPFALDAAAGFIAPLYAHVARALNRSLRVHSRIYNSNCTYFYITDEILFTGNVAR